MAWVAVAIGGATLVGGIYSASQQADAASEASAAQQEGNSAAIAEQRRQFDAVQKMLDPYSQLGLASVGQLAPYQQAGVGALPGLQQFASSGNDALAQQRSLIGLNGAQAQQGAISGIQQSPLFAALQKQGEQSILANASATGGLRGGNVQGALAQFSPNLLNQLIEQQYSRLGAMSATGGTVAQGLAQGGLTTTQNMLQLGQSSAAGTGNAALASGNSIANLLQANGAAQAGNALAQGQAQSGYGSAIAGALGAYSGARYLGSRTV